MRTRGGASRVAVAVLAAGTSTRMGSEGKRSATLDGKALIQHVVAAAQASRADPVVVVLGNLAKEIQALLGRAPEVSLELVEDSSPEGGLAPSWLAGVQALPAETWHRVEEPAGPSPGAARRRTTRDTEEPAPWRH